ncbi:MAG: hypothetical protein ACHREM_30070, partial [Polyangiales bacterium]
GCSGSMLQVCDPTGTWKDTTGCTYACVAGSCTGVCVPGTKRCDPAAASVQTCDLTGTWQDTSSCTYVCSAGACAGVCTPGTKQCGTGATATTQLCGSDGEWQAGVACPTPAVALNEMATCSSAVCGTACLAAGGVQFADCNGLASDGCEVNLAKDSHHCGTCSRDCFSGACGSSMCEPAYIITGPIPSESQPLYLAADSTTVYWTDGYGAGSVRSANASTFAVTTIASTQPGANWIRELSGSIFWSTEATISGVDYGSINAYAITTAKETNVVSTQLDLGILGNPFAVNSTHAMWLGNATSGNVDLWSTPLAGGSPHLLSATVYPSSTMEADDNYVYTTESGLGNVVRYSTSTGVRSLLASGQSTPFRLALANGVLYWTNLEGGSAASPTPGSVMSLNLTTGTPTPLATNLTYPEQIASDGVNVYYTQLRVPPCASYGLWRLPVGGGTPFFLTCATSLTTNIAVGAQYIFYSDGTYVFALAK